MLVTVIKAFLIEGLPTFWCWVFLACDDMPLPLRPRRHVPLGDVSAVRCRLSPAAGPGCRGARTWQLLFWFHNFIILKIIVALDGVASITAPHGVNAPGPKVFRREALQAQTDKKLQP